MLFHQGCTETAKKLILAAKAAGVDCVKFQKSELGIGARWLLQGLLRSVDLVLFVCRIDT